MCSVGAQHPQIIGHRGAMGHAPENTVLSIQKALDLGVDGIALDSREKLAIYVATKLPGDSVVIEFQRDERTMSVKAPLIS